MLRSSIWLLSFTNAVLTTQGFSSRVFVSTPVNNPTRFVEDCMTVAPTTLLTDATVDEAIGILLDLGYSGAPVVDDSGSLVGVVSAFDIIQKEAGGALLPMEGSVETVEGYASAAKKIIAKKVGDLMTENPITIGPNASMREAAALMTANKLHRLPVVADGKLIGILSTSDVMKDVLTSVRRLLPEAKEVSP
uniref:CBS domain-containing protein n=1 Tax=Ditylum brightwellii TaxID=49249 RepID=A0A6V2JFU4_9STRA|mmetsp:Transcript_24674/g.35881  ORF Transcript_24674/g.35881 Transcript_24674/m.35881 type:complete len:192 (-) Transcript_24674:322-897(-)